MIPKDVHNLCTKRIWPLAKAASRLFELVTAGTSLLFFFLASPICRRVTPPTPSPLLRGVLGGVWFWCTIIDLRLDDCVAFGVGGWFLGRYPSWTGAGIATHLVSLPFVFAVAIRIDCYEVSWGKVSFDEWVILYVVYEAVRPWWYWELAEMRLAVLPCQLPFPYWYTCMPLNGGEVCWSA